MHGSRTLNLSMNLMATCLLPLLDYTSRRRKPQFSTGRPKLGQVENVRAFASRGESLVYRASGRCDYRYTPIDY